jgi:hypothetical protein
MNVLQAIGKTLLCSPPRAREVDGHDYNKYVIHRRLVYVFSLFGIVNSLVIFTCCGVALRQINSLAQDNNAYWEKHGVDDFFVNWTANLQQLIILGAIILVCSAFGLFAAFYGRFVPMLLYAIYVIIGTVCCVFVGALVVRQSFTDQNHQWTSFRHGQLRRDTQNTAITFWNVLRKMGGNNSYTDQIETENQCCGWYNALDYCETDHISGIMYAAVREEDFGAYMANSFARD